MQLLNVDWLTSGLERSREPQETGELQKNVKKSKMKPQTVAAVDSSLFLTRLYLSSLYAITLLFSTAGSQANNNMSNSGP